MASLEITTRQQILDSCVALLEQYKGQRLRMRDIAEAANVAIPTIYYHFSDREALLAEAHAIRILGIFSEIDGARMATASAVAAVDLEGYVAAVARSREPLWDPANRETIWRYMEALTELHHDPVVFKAVATVLEERIMKRVDTVAELQRLGWVTDRVDAGQWVLFYLGSVFGQVFWDLCPGIDSNTAHNSAVDWIHATISTQGADVSNRRTEPTSD